MYCKNCGKEIDNDSNFCTFCGIAIINNAITEPGSPVTTEQSDLATEKSEMDSGNEIVSETVTQAEQSEAGGYMGANEDSNVPHKENFSQNTNQTFVNTQQTISGAPGGQPNNVQHCNNIYTMFRDMFSSNLFLVICILQTVACGLPFVKMFFNNALIKGEYFVGTIENNYSITFNIIEILMLIAVWMLYAAAKSNNQGGFLKPLKLVYGVTVAEFVCLWVIIGVIALASLVLILFGTSEIMRRILYQLNIYKLPMIILGVMCIIVAGLLTLFNIFCYGTFCRCAKSFAHAAETGYPYIEKIKATRGWVMTVGILEAFTAIGVLQDGLIEFVITAASAVSYIMLYVMLGKIHLPQEPQPFVPHN